MAGNLIELFLLPAGLGLLGFIEPCTIGSSLLFLHYLEGRSPREQLAQTLAFTVTRGVLMGLLGMAAVFVGTAFVGFQKGAWAVMGAAYMALGLAYLTGSVDRLKRSLGAGLGRLDPRKGAMVLGAIFALNIPACAGPLLAALLGAAALTQAANPGRGFVMLAVFGLALSMPIALAVLSRRGRWLLERVGRYGAHAPRVIGLLFLILGAWSIRFALVAEVLP